LGRRLIGKSRAAPVGRRSDRRCASVRAALEGLEDRRLMSADPLAHVNDVQPLPFVLEFDAPVDGLHDKDGQDVGLTRVQVNENGLAASYLPANFDLRTDLGVLRVTSTGTSTAGSNFNNDNTLTNALETQFDATTAGWQVTTRLVGPLGFLDRASEQGGVYFGPDQDNYVKLVASVTTASNVASIEFTDEQLNGTTYVHSVSSKTDVGPFAAINTLDLRLVGDATTGKVTAFYALNGGAFQKVAAEVTLPTDKRPAFFNAAGRAGLITAHKNDVGPVTLTYDRFEIQPGETPDPTARPSVIATRPAAGATGVARDGYIAADLSLPNGGVDSATLSAATVKLFRTGDGAPVPGEPGTTGGGDQILFTPAVLLDPNTRYTFEITDGVHDSTGAAFLPFSTSFTTASAAPPIDPTLSFEKVRLPSTAGLRFTALKVGPDGKLYAGVVDGRIIRYSINDDGTLGAAQTITTLQTANGGNRLLTGITFDPASTAANPILWVTHGQYAFGETTTDYADDWTSKLTKLSGPALATVQDVLVNLPRSARDHLTNQPTFGPDGALYFPQGSNSSMGAPDPAWDHRIERMLSGAVLRLDPRKLPATLPLDVKTPDGGGAYDPSAAGAPLTLYATGVRNAFDLVWTRDGTLYAPTNGSAAGGSTPYGPGVPGLEAVKTTQHDFLFNVQPGGYYGHPNPVRDQFVMGGGYTPANGLGVNEVAEYGAATGGLAVNPDPNYRGYAWDFGLNISPNGALEYANTNAFGGMLAGKILVTRYSGPGDIVVLTRNPDGSIRSQNTGVAGLKGFVDPIDITEDPSTGNLYVSDYGQRNGAARQIYLLRPIPAGANLSTGKDQLVFSDIITSSHAGPSPNLSLRITNTGTVPLAFPTGGVRVIDDPASAGDDSGLFKVVNAASLPDTIGVGESFDVALNFTAPAVGIESAFLRIQSNDADRPTFDVALRGVGVPGTGGAYEPSLARILRAYQIPTIVGDGPNDSGEADTAYPLNPDPSSQEVAGMQRLVKAGTGPVTFEVLAAEAINTNPSVKFGYYTPGNRGWDSKRELFTISGADAQSLQATPNGVTSFDPGQSAFGLYTIYPGFQKPQDGGLPREVFSEDALNLWDATASRRHKVRFFPLREKNGTVVPNAYIVAFEEFDTAFDSNDLVAIVRNVRPAPAGPELGLENMDVVPFSDRLAFNKIQNYVNSDRPNNSFHQTAVMRIRNTGSAPLVLGTLSTTGDFTLDSPPAGGTSVAPGAFLDLTVRFTATSSTNGKMKLGTLTVNSNDADEPATVIQLGGYWQSRNEGGQEPGLQEIVNTYGFKTQIIYSGQVLNQGGRIVRVGDEVLSPYWFRADTSSPATARQLAAFHTQGNTASLYWHAKGSTTVTKLFTEDGVWGQSFLPPLSGSNGTLPSFAAFSPTGAFGWRIDGKEWSDPTKNPAPAGQPQDQGHHVRFWVARDRTGAIIPNTYIMSMDYAGINYDYNDNVFLLTNIRPESPPKAPTAVVASGGGAGIGIDWADQTEANLGGYNVYRSAAATGPWTKLTATPVTASAFADLFAPANATSFYYVTAVDLNGTESGASLVVSASRSNDTTPPARPASLTAKGLATGITLDWTDNPEADLSGYNVLRAASSAGPFTKLNSTILKTSSFVDITAPAGVTSYYQVIAIDLSGNVSAAATASAVRPSSTSLPNSPPSTSANAVSQTRIDVSWGAATNATTYRLERKGPGEANFTEVAAGLTGLTYTDNAVAAGGTYAYRVRAENSAGLSGYGPLATATTPTNPVPPAAPGGTTATAVNAGRVDVSWSAPAGATSYRLERQGPGETAFREIAAGLSGTSYQDTAVLPSSTYQYRVRAQNAAGLSGYGPTAGATTPAVVTGAYAGADVGRVRPSAGSTVVVAEGKAYDVTAGGADIQGTADEFHFAYRQVSGDFDMKIRVASLTRANEWTKAGLMIREGLAAGSANVFVMATPDVHGYRLTYRPTDGGSTLAKGTGLVSYPNTWVRLQRRGDVVSGYRSSDGVNWLLVGSARLTLPQAVYFGMAVTSHNAAATATAQFRDLADVATTTPPPAAPATLSATPFSPTAINLSWAASPGATGYRIERLNPGAADYVPIITSVPGTTYQDTGLQASTTYVYRVRAENAGGASAYSPTAGATTQPDPTTGSLTGVDVGPTAPAGSTREIVAGRDYDVTAGGADISGTVDQFHFAYKQVTGDFDVKVRVQSLTNTSSFAKAGIMARTGLGAGAANVMALITPAEQGARLTFRRTDGAITESTGSGSAPAVFPNAWIRLRRLGDTFTYFRSADGVTWTSFKSITLALGQTMYLGLAATSHNTAAATVAQFRGFGNV
jgi:fibronectin type 3 domain-containing protein/regulation of enolase protein 1 (concanavalin A-like superfamily)